MGWFDSLTTREDPLKDLDPELRKYLQSQKPSSYKTAQETGASEPLQSYREQLGLKHNDPEKQHQAKTALAAAHSSTTTTTDVSSDTDTTTPAPLPSASLYPDGRYAHLWSTYRPQSEVEEAGKSDQEKLLDIVHGYKERQAEVGRAALENCSDEQWAVHECFRSGSWSALSTMCRKENRALSRCVVMQSRFLRALGYLSMYERSAEESERIQMHADLLYQRMLEQERVNLEAKERGGDAQTATAASEAAADRRRDLALLSQASTTPLPPLPPHRPSPINFETLPPQVQERLAKAKFTGLEGEALEIARREFDNDLAFHTDIVRRLDEYYMADRRERLGRLEAGNERFGDKVKRWFDFKKYPEGEGEGQGAGGERNE